MRQTKNYEIGSMGMSTATLNKTAALGAPGRRILQAWCTFGVDHTGTKTIRKTPEWRSGIIRKKDGLKWAGNTGDENTMYGGHAGQIRSQRGDCLFQQVPEEN